MNKLPCWFLDKYEIREMPTPDIRGWTPEEIGPTTIMDEMSDEDYNNWHEVPLSPEAEEVLLAYAGTQLEIILPSS